MRVGAVKGLVVVNQFLPKEVTVREGDTVRWTFPIPFPHTVSFYGDQPASFAFLNAERADHRPSCPNRACGPVGWNLAVAYPRGDPRAFDGSEVLNSGVLPGEIFHQAGGDTFKVTFIKAGTYHYVDSIFYFQGTVNVVAPEVQVPSQSVTEAEAEKQLQVYLAEGQQVLDGLTATSTANPDGTKTWTLPMGPATNNIDIPHFLPDRLKIGLGDTVRWINEGPLEPHVVTFTSGGEVPAYIVPEPQDTGPPRLPFNPRHAAPAGAKTYDGTGYVNSGLLGGVFFNPDVKEWSLKFTAAGEFAYVCPVHYALGMTGTIVVTE